jgi:hypothetical protein
LNRDTAQITMPDEQVLRAKGLVYQLQLLIQSASERIRRSRELLSRLNQGPPQNA